ncbi:hypothetical protein ACNKHU_12465 [Shigella flexneri]
MSGAASVANVDSERTSQTSVRTGRRDLAPAIALAALAAKRSSPESDPLMLVLAADDLIADEDAFRTAGA